MITDNNDNDDKLWIDSGDDTMVTVSIDRDYDGEYDD